MPVGLVEVDALLLAELVDGHSGPAPTKQTAINKSNQPTHERHVKNQ